MLRGIRTKCLKLKEVQVCLPRARDEEPLSRAIISRRRKTGVRRAVIACDYTTKSRCRCRHRRHQRDRDGRHGAEEKIESAPAQAKLFRKENIKSNERKNANAVCGESERGTDIFSARNKSGILESFMGLGNFPVMSEGKRQGAQSRAFGEHSAQEHRILMETHTF